MGTSRSFGEMSRKLEGLTKDLSGPIPVRQFADRAKKELVPLVERAVRGDIGDTSMSGWRRGSPIGVTGDLKVQGDSIIILPVRQAAGPMRVLESGRNAYVMGDRRVSGFRLNKKLGVRVQKTRKVKRASGATQGKGSWSDAAEAIVQRAPRVQRAVVTAALRKRF